MRLTITSVRGTLSDVRVISSREISVLSMESGGQGTSIVMHTDGLTVLSRDHVVAGFSYTVT